MQSLQAHHCPVTTTHTHTHTHTPSHRFHMFNSRATQYTLGLLQTLIVTAEQRRHQAALCPNKQRWKIKYKKLFFSFKKDVNSSHHHLCFILWPQSWPHKRSVKELEKWPKWDQRGDEQNNQCCFDLELVAASYTQACCQWWKPVNCTKTFFEVLSWDGLLLVLLS